MATSAAPAPASSGQGRGSSSSAADDPPDPSAAWYLTKAQLEKTPARKALLQKFGQDAEKAKEKEAQYRRLTVGFLQEAGQKLRLCVPRPARRPCAPACGSSVVGEQGHGARALLGVCTRCPVGPGNIVPTPNSPRHTVRGAFPAAFFEPSRLPASRRPQLSIATAIVFYHRFYSRHSYDSYDRFRVATTCLFLAGKVEETPKKIKDVVIETYRQAG